MTNWILILEILIPIAGVATVAYLIFKKRPSVPPSSQQGESVHVDIDGLIRRSTINKTVKFSTIPRTTGAERIRNAEITMEVLLKSVPLGVAFAALVNADYESKLSNKATNGNAIGLYQLMPHFGLSVDERRNPVTNTLAIMGDFRKSGGPVMAAYNSGGSVAQLAGLFGKYVERTGNPKVLELRSAYARRLFPSIADIAARRLV